MSIYEEMLEAGIIIGNHHSDLYVKDTPAAWAIFEKYRGQVSIPSRFVSNTGEGRCLDFAFCYSPYWNQITNKVASTNS